MPFRLFEGPKTPSYEASHFNHRRIERAGPFAGIDAGGGNDKDRPKLKVLDHLRTPYLARLAAAGARPEEIDYVLLTHLHADHVGWNTRLVEDHWAPTFPNATIHCSGREWRYGMALAAKDDTAVRAVRAEAGPGEPTRGVGIRDVHEERHEAVTELSLETTRRPPVCAPSRKP